MDILIQGANFVHNDKGITKEFCLKWEKLHDGTRTTAQVVSAFQAFGRKLMEPQCPFQRHEGWVQALHLFRDLRNIMSQQVSSGTTSKQCFHEMLFPIIIDWFHHGPATIHMDIITDLLQNHVLVLPEFMASLRGDDLLRLVRAVTSPVVKREETPDRKFYSSFMEFMGIYLRIGVSESQLFELDIMNLMMDFAFDLFIDYTHVPDNSVNSISRAAKNILSIYSKPFANKLPKEAASSTSLKAFQQQLLTFDSQMSKPSERRRHYSADSDSDPQCNNGHGIYVNWSTYKQNTQNKNMQSGMTMLKKDQESLDVPRLKSYIKRYAALALTPGFPRSKATGDLFYESFTTIMKQMKTSDKIEIFCNDVFDLLEVVSQCQGEVEYVLRVFSAGVVFLDQRDSIKDRMTVFEAVAPRFKTLLELIEPVFFRETRLTLNTERLLTLSYGKEKEANSLWLSLIVPLMRQPTVETIEACRSFIRGKIKWKDHQDVVNEILNVIEELRVPSIQKKDSYLGYLCDCIGYLLSGLEKARILKNFGEKFMNLGIHLLESREEGLFDAAEKMGEHIEINVKEKKHSVIDGMQRIHVILKDENLSWGTAWRLPRALTDVFKGTFKGVKDAKIFSDEDFKLFVDMSITCLAKEMINQENGRFSSHYEIAMTIMVHLLKWVGQVKKVDLAKELIPLLLSKLEEDDDNDKIWKCVGRHLSDFAQADATVIAPYTDQLIKLYLENEHADSYINTVYTICSRVEVTLKDHQFQELMKNMLELEDRDSSMMVPMIFLLMAKTKGQAELFTEENIKDILKMAKSTSQCHGILIQVVQEFSKRKPGKLIMHLDLLLDNDGWDDMFAVIRNEILGTLAIYNKAVAAERILDYFIAKSKTTQDKSTLLTALNSVRLIGYNNLDILKARRQDIEKLQMNDLDVGNMKQSILDMIDGKTPEDVLKLLDTQQEAVSGLMEKVEDVEITMTAVVEELEEQKTDLQNVKNDVVEQSNSLDQIKETVENTVAKVEEIDQKTLSHAPYWSRDISKLLNPPTEHDWRLLSSRLGYDNADIRGWAQQADPCMAMLNEWYATRKTSEATFAILNNLQEMNRVDASLIVENAMKKAEAVVEDECFEYASPPEIFLSYQWGHQDEVKLLHRHLSMAGYDCWMDIGQMGGGDKLFEKIDSGMRAAKLVISCVTSKYAKSPNCNREVNLAVGVKKTIIPLLLENCSWPPPGSMGPLFSESLYIQFFQTCDEETEDERYWPVEKFQELLMQLSANGLTPDQNKIEQRYRDWWMPLQEEIKIDKSKTKDGGKNIESRQTESDDMSGKSPDVFISYQWGKQKKITKLYQKLTSLGISCWLDIKQMGGGDALFDKIDRGIRGCKIVLSCVTKKYALSANCRREVSLTDALKKPMLPLLLDEMTWPPSGPMSMIMTQLPYIDFHEESAQTEWIGPKFEELISKINQHLPKSVIEEQTSVEDDKIERKRPQSCSGVRYDVQGVKTSRENIEKNPFNGSSRPSSAPLKKTSRACSIS